MKNDDKRFYRELKKQVKKAGNKKVRRDLKKQMDENPEEAHFLDDDYGHNESSVFNGRDGKNRKRKK